MKLQRTLGVGAVAGLILVGVPSVALADDISRTGSYTVPAGRTIDGDLTVSGGTVTIHGTVKGNVKQTGNGTVVIGARGLVEGNVDEYGAGDITVYGTVKGNVTERVAGHTRVEAGALVEGNAAETGDGSIAVRGTVKGNVTERDAGSASIVGAVDGNVIEAGTSHLYLYGTARVNGNAYEKDSGNLYLYRGARVGGDIVEGGSGSLARR